MDKNARFFSQMIERIMLFIGLVVSSSASNAAEFRIRCPELASDAVQIVQTPAGWTQFTPSALRTDYAGVMYGPPAEKMEAKPDFTEKRKNGFISTWHFDGEFNLGKWISCSYGLSTVTLSQELPKNTTVCKISTMREHRYANPEVEISCQSK